MSASTTKTGKKGKETMSIVTVVSFGGSSKSAFKIAMVHTVGSRVMLTILADITKDGANFIRGHGWNRMYEISGAKEIVEQQGNGND
jgi:hypothetical protein